ncbi:divergent polysaccharide deacetylase family protein, partial [Rhodosalinus sediminis]
AAPPAPAADPAPDAPEAPADGGTRQADVPGRGAGDLAQLAPEIPTDRLPRVGTEAAQSGPEAEVPGAPLPPIRRYAAEADLPAGAPRLAIVLVDDGTLTFGAEAVASLPVPVSVAIDPAREGAAAAMAAYRTRGVEVLAAPDLPDGAAPRDAEIAAGAWFATLPEAVAVIEGRAGALQQDRALAEQIAGILADEGRGLVLHRQGLDTGLALAARAGVPAAPLFRRFGEAGETAAIRRQLERAVLRARSEGAAIVAGPLRADVLPVLVSWGLATRDAGIALAPASAVLLGEE